MSPDVRRFQAFFVCCVLLAGLCAASFAGLRDATAHQVRGMSEGFSQPVFGADRLTLGVNTELAHLDDAALDARLALLRASGARDIRQVFRWSDLEPRRGAYDWRGADRIFAAARKHGLTVLAVLMTSPEWARGPSGSSAAPATETQPPADPIDLANFAAAFAARYDGAVRAYQIWDEPNLSSAWGNALINPPLYLQMLRASGDAIKRVNPDAVIALAALAPTVEQSNVNLAPQTFLLRLYQLGGHQAFDVVSAKPYGFDFPPDDRRVDANLLNFSHLILLREVMVAHEEGHKAIWAAQFGWNALPPGWRGDPSIWGAVSEAEQAAYVRTAVQRAAREWPWLGAMYLETFEPAPRPDRPSDDARWGFALLDQTGARRPVFDAFAAALGDAASAPRAALFANCATPQSVARTLRLENLITALPEVTAARRDCQGPSPHAVFSDGWRFDQLGADIPERPDANVRVRFSGESLALIVRRGNYRAYTYVSIDGAPVNLLPHDARGAYLIMTSPGLYPVIETIPVASGLGPGEHVAEITVERGWNQWALIGWSARGAASTPGAGLIWALPVLGLLALFGAAWSWRRAAWRRISLPTRSWRAIAAGIGLWLASSMTWAQDAATAWRNLGLPFNTVLGATTSALLFWSPLLIVSLALCAALFALIVRRVDVGLMLAAFFIPFFLLPQRIFARSFPMIEILTLMCAVALAVQAAPRVRAALRRDALSRIDARQLFARLTALDYGVLLFVSVGLASTFGAAQQVEAWRELRLVILEPALLYLVLRAARLEPGTPRLVLTALVIGAVAVVCIGLFNYARGERFIAEGGLPRIKSIFNSANNDALFLERALPFALVAIFAPLGGRWCRIAALVASALIGLALLLTQSRGALLFGVPASVITILLLMGGRWRVIGVIGLITAVLGIAALFSGALTPFLQGTRLANAFDLTRGTGFFRLNLWQSAWRMFLDHPLLGVGPDNFLYAYRSFYILPAAWQEPNLSHPHNVLFDWLTRLGLLGTAAGMLMIGGLITGIRRRLGHATMRPVAIASAGFLAAALAHGLVDHSFFLIDLMFVFMLVAGLIMWRGSDARAGSS
jgi:O-antigen ligase